MKERNFTIGVFMNVTNALENGYPVIECIKSWLTMVDQIAIQDGGATDGTIDAIKALDDDRIIINQDAGLLWEKKWTYARIAWNLNRGMYSLDTDFRLKSDADFVVNDEDALIRACKDAMDNRIFVSHYTRKNFIQAGWFFYKKQNPCIVNWNQCDLAGLNIAWGFDYKNFGDDQCIVIEDFDCDLNGIPRYRGEGLLTKQPKWVSDFEVYNYGYVFRNEEQCIRVAGSNLRALRRSQGIEGWDNKTDEEYWNEYFNELRILVKEKPRINLKIEEHPIYIQEKLKNMTPDMLGNGFNGKLI